MNMNITNQLGQLTELWCQIDFCERGIVLSQPTNPSSRYDFIADINNKLYRIQCKTAHEESNDRFSFRTMSKNWNNGEYKNYIGDIDFFYCHWQDKGYLFPIELCGEKTREKFIRIGEESQYHSNNINAIYGKDYEFDKIISTLGSDLEKITIESAIKETTKKEPKKNNKCIDCGKEINKNAVRCVDCYIKSRKPSDMPTRDELKTLIRNKSFVKIGEDYGKTDNAIRKWCDFYSLPRKKTDIKKISDEDWKLI